MKNQPEPSFDRETALEGVGHQVSLLRELAELYIGEVASMVSEVRAALDANNVDDVGRALHSFRGAIGYFHAAKLNHILSEMYSLAEQGELELVRGRWATLVAASDHLNCDLKALIDEQAN